MFQQNFNFQLILALRLGSHRTLLLSYADVHENFSLLFLYTLMIIMTSSYVYYNCNIIEDKYYKD